MPKGRTSRCRTRLALAFTLLLALAAAACGDGGGPAVTPSGPGAPERVTYEAEDGLRIVADFYPPLEGKPAPAVLLLHQFNGSRVQWATLIPDLRQWGYAVLAPDLRSFGDSTIILREGSQEQYELTDLDDMLRDVAAAIEYLKTRDEVDAEAIAVVGASVGGNLAYVASGAFPQIRTTVSMSPNASPLGDGLLGRNVPGFSPRSVLFMSDQAEASDAQALADNVAQPVDVRIYDTTTAHGVELLENPDVKPDIRDWLARMLLSITAPGVGLGTPVSYSSEDVREIVAAFLAPPEIEHPPVVILLHQFEENRDQWADLIAALVEMGYAVLAPDLRSLGEVVQDCRLAAPPIGACFDDLLRDVVAAVTYLESREDVNSERIGVIGSNLGANLAYVASGIGDTVNTAIAVSPNANPQDDALLGGNLSTFSPRSVLFISNEAAAADARALAQNVAPPVDVRVYPDATAHSVALLDSPQAVQDIRDWLNANLALGSGE